MSIITFIVPSINRPTLGNTIQSLLNQTNPNWKCFVLYDGVDGKDFTDPRIETFKLEKLGKLLRGNSLPFGGIQIILSGDFLQLPCVKSDNFLFEAESWNNVVREIHYLDEIVRQKDVDFCRVLDKIRVANIDTEV